MSEQSEALKKRATCFAVAILRLAEQFPRTVAAEDVGRQLARSATSVAANYRATCNARSRAEFIAKLGTVVEEADECVGWFEMIILTKLLPLEIVTALNNEAQELRAIFAKSLGTARRNARPKSKVPRHYDQMK
jgi:four helix bundle protein